MPEPSLVPNNIFAEPLWKRQFLATSLFGAALSRQQLAHAYLLTGRANADKWKLAASLACHLNCQGASRTTAGSCARDAIEVAFGQTSEAGSSPLTGMCQNCRWILQQAHPQAWLILAGEETKTGKIPVEKARLLSEELAKTSQFLRVVIVPEANQEIFHRPAANALLKTIEEPESRCLFLLFATQIEEVLPTIVSRCQTIPLLQGGQTGIWLSAGSAFPGKQEPADDPIPGATKQLRQSPSGNYNFTSVSAATASLDSTAEWSQHLEALASSDLGVEMTLDLVAALEIESLKPGAAADPDLSLYLSRLLSLAETAKDQIDRYVPLKAAIESFAWGCYRLRHPAVGATRSLGA